MKVAVFSKQLRAYILKYKLFIPFPHYIFLSIWSNEQRMYNIIILFICILNLYIHLQGSVRSWVSCAIRNRINIRIIVSFCEESFTTLLVIRIELVVDRKTNTIHTDIVVKSKKNLYIPCRWCMWLFHVIILVLGTNTNFTNHLDLSILLIFWTC